MDTRVGEIDSRNKGLQDTAELAAEGKGFLHHIPAAGLVARTSGRWHRRKTGLKHAIGNR